MTQRSSQRVKVADSDFASDMQTTLFASSGAEKGGDAETRRRGGSMKGVMNRESFSLQFKERRGRSWHSELLAYYQPGCGMALVGTTPTSKPCRKTRAGFVAMAPCLGPSAMLTLYKRAHVSP